MKSLIMLMLAMRTSELMVRLWSQVRTHAPAITRVRRAPCRAINHALRTVEMHTNEYCSFRVFY